MYLRRRLGLVLVFLALVAAGFALAAGTGHSRASSTTSLHAAAVSSTGSPKAAPAAPAKPAPPALLVRPKRAASASWRPVAFVHGVPAAWIAQRGGVTLLRFDQSGLRVDLHAGSSDGGVEGWKYGDQISSSEIHHVVAAFNGGFKFSYGGGVGFVSGGHVGLPLKAGLASIVTYTDGTTDVGAWRAGVPSPGRTVYSVLQNQHLLVDHGEVAANAATCILECWGGTIKDLTSVARSAVGIRADGQLVWAAGESLLPSELGHALVQAGAVRAVELDINPDWVAGYLYVHSHSGPVPVPVVPGQIGIAGKLLEPYSRDFLTIVAR